MEEMIITYSVSRYSKFHFSTIVFLLASIHFLKVAHKMLSEQKVSMNIYCMLMKLSIPY